MIPGLSLVEDYLSDDHAAVLPAFLRSQLDSLPITTDGSTGRSRILRYGFDYDPPHPWLRTIPVELRTIVPANAVTVNEYKSGHGISPHIDSTAFADSISILSLNAPAVMRFHKKDCEPVSLVLTHNSLLTMTGEARYLWQHSIAPLKKGPARLSVVFRTLNPR